MIVLDEVEMERRLGKIEGQLQAAASIALLTQSAQSSDAANKHTIVMERLTNIDGKLEKQNGRVSKLEVWRTQEATLITILVGAGPFVFWALNRWAG